MAVFCLAVLLVALGIAALLSLPQWGEDSVIPEVSVTPGPGVALDDAVAVSPGRRLAVSPARPAAAGEPRLAASRTSEDESSPGAFLAVAPARAVASPAEDVQAGSPEVPSAAPAPAPAPQSAPVPVATPVSAPSPSSEPVAPQPSRPGYGGSPTSPGSAGGPGPEGGPVTGPVEVHNGDEYAYSFSFYIQPQAYRAPGEENLILRFADEAGEEHSFGLQLWDDGSGTQRGLWASGEAMGDERFLAPVTEGVWHQLVFTFEASSEGDGLYLLLLDGEPIDARAWVSLIDSASGYGLLEAGLFRGGERVEGAPEVYFGPANLGETLESVIP